MQISKIMAFKTPYYTRQTNNKTQNNSQKSLVDSFTKSNDISFKSNYDFVGKYSVDWGYENFYVPNDDEYTIYYPKQRKLNILKGSEEHLRDVAESLFMYRNEDIENFTKIYYPLRLDVNIEKSQKALSRLMPYITELRAKMADLNEMLAKVKSKHSKHASTDTAKAQQYILEEIERLTKKNERAKIEYLDSVDVAASDTSNDWQID